jgi:hypothetical protein
MLSLIFWIMRCWGKIGDTLSHRFTQIDADSYSEQEFIAMESS